MSGPQISRYCGYGHDNYGCHAMKIDLNGVLIWFSYRTPIAFQVRNDPIVMRENDWGPTTGGHMRSIMVYWDESGKDLRIPGEKFEEMLDNVLKRFREIPYGRRERDPGEAAVEALLAARKSLLLAMSAMRRKDKWGRIKFKLNDGDRAAILKACRGFRDALPRFLRRKPKRWEPNTRSSEKVDSYRFYRLLVEDKRESAD